RRGEEEPGMPGDPNANTSEIPNRASDSNRRIGGGAERVRSWAADECGAINEAMARHPIRILGIDPGLRRTGWGLIEADGNRLIHIACGSLETNERAELSTRLLAIHDGLIAVLEQYQPHEAAA